MANDDTPPNILQNLGNRLARHRLNKNLTQAELALRAGISLATLKRIEQGNCKTLLANVANILLALGLEDGLKTLVPDAPPSPLQLTNAQKRTRKRAGRKRKVDGDGDSQTWTWKE